MRHLRHDVINVGAAGPASASRLGYQDFIVNGFCVRTSAVLKRHRRLRAWVILVAKDFTQRSANCKSLLRRSSPTLTTAGSAVTANYPMCSMWQSLARQHQHAVRLLGASGPAAPALAPSLLAAHARPFSAVAALHANGTALADQDHVGRTESRSAGQAGLPLACRHLSRCGLLHLLHTA